MKRKNNFSILGLFGRKNEIEMTINGSMRGVRQVFLVSIFKSVIYGVYPSTGITELMYSSLYVTVTVIYFSKKPTQKN